MNSLFRTHNELTEPDYKVLWENCVFVFDANVLLDLYRLPENAKKDLLAILTDEKISNRIWLPFQISLEYIHNKVEAIGDQKNKYNVVRNIIDDGIEQVHAVYAEIQKRIAELQLKKRHSVINPDPFINESLFSSPIQRLNEFRQQLDDLDQKQADVNDTDAIRQKISSIFEGKIGTPFTKEELEAIYKEGEIRYKENIPPGYKDKTKDGLYLFEDKKIDRKFGDLIFWKEILKKCNDDNIEYLVLVTGDVKEDWWQQKRGKKLGPRYELLNELYFNAKSVKLFHMYDTSSFMQYSKEYLQINIKEQSIAETKDLLEYVKTNTYFSIGSETKIHIQGVIDSVVEFFPNLRVRYFNTVLSQKYLTASRGDVHLILLEIFSNIAQYSTNRRVSVRAFNVVSYLAIRFRTNINPDVYEQIDTRGSGFALIGEILNKYGGRIRISKTLESYRVVIYFGQKYVVNDEI